MNYKDRLQKQLDFSRKTSESFLASFQSPEEWVYQVHPAGKHALWFAGHMTMADNAFAGYIDPKFKRELPATFNPIFGMKSEPVSDASKYPPAAEVLGLMGECRAAFMAAVAELKEEELTKPLTGGPPFLTDIASLLELAIWHEALHSGQISINRRALGHPPLLA